MAEPQLYPGAHWQAAAGGHPPEEAWERLACGELSEHERRSLLDHVVDCAECTRIWRALVALERGARRFDPGVPKPGLATPRRPAPRAWTWGLGGALAAAAAAALIVWAGVRPQLPEPPRQPAGETFRSGPEAPARPVLRAPLGAVAAPQTFTWDPVPEAVSYRVELLDADGEIVWSTPTAETSAAWPSTLPHSPGRFYWRVVAELERGGSTASALEDFDVLDGPRYRPPRRRQDDAR
jgi:hypothetical protein